MIAIAAPLTATIITGSNAGPSPGGGEVVPVGEVAGASKMV